MMARGQGDSYTSHRQQRHVNASDFFHSLSGKAKTIADEEAHRMADTMQKVLVNRLGLGPGNGRFPRYNPALPDKNGKRRGGESKKMFNTWRKQKRGSGEYWIFTDGVDPEHHNYAQQLVTGKGWPSKVVGGELKYLVRKGDLLFSTQMPNGLEPWFNDKRNLFKQRVEKRISEELS
jgi:hypothetical protein